MSSFGKVSYHLANNICIDDPGTILAEPRSEDENLALTVMAGIDPVWIGVTDEDEEGTFVYQSDRTGIKYSNWNEGEPNNRDIHDPNGEDYVAMVGLLIL